MAGSEYTGLSILFVTAPGLQGSQPTTTSTCPFTVDLAAKEAVKHVQAATIKGGNQIK